MNTRSFLFALLGLISTAFLNGCLQPPPGSESEVWRRPPRYGAGGTANRNRSSSSNPSRYGYSGSSETPPADTGGSAASRDRDSGMAAGDLKKEDKPAANKPAVDKKPSGPPAVGEMPFAKGVPGKPLFVTIPGRSNLGEVSIEQYDANNQPTGKPLPPGTPVEIPDPGNPGKQIYFRVP